MNDHHRSRHFLMFVKFPDWQDKWYQKDHLPCLYENPDSLRCCRYRKVIKFVDNSPAFFLRYIFVLFTGFVTNIYSFLFVNPRVPYNWKRFRRVLVWRGNIFVIVRTSWEQRRFIDPVCGQWRCRWQVWGRSWLWDWLRMCHRCRCSYRRHVIGDGITWRIFLPRLGHVHIGDMLFQMCLEVPDQPSWVFGAAFLLVFIYLENRWNNFKCLLYHKPLSNEESNSPGKNSETCKGVREDAAFSVGNWQFTEMYDSKIPVI